MRVAGALSGPSAASDETACEHFVTLFDASFLPIGLALYRSLERCAAPFRLWVVAVDEEAERLLGRLSLPRLSIIPLCDLETPELLAVKPGRTRGEYCWTITPFTFAAVFEREPTVQRVTYLDSDLFFFDDPRVLLREMDESGKQVLITEHAYAPEYDRSHDSGRFCVQFLTFRRTDAAKEVMQWWQDRCVEWCFARYENGKFGDQVYLDQWPRLFGERLHIVQQADRTLAPWNVRHFSDQNGTALQPVFFHFHGLRLLGGRRVRLFRFYDVGRAGARIYANYLQSLGDVMALLEREKAQVPPQGIPRSERFGWLRALLRRWQGTERVARIPRVDCTLGSASSAAPIRDECGEDRGLPRH